MIKFCHRDALLTHQIIDKAWEHKCSIFTQSTMLVSSHSYAHQNSGNDTRSSLDLCREQRKGMTFYPLDDDEEVFKPRSKSSPSSQKSSFKSAFDNEVPEVSKDKSIETETRREEMGIRDSESRLSESRRSDEDMSGERRVIDRWNKHSEDNGQSPSPKSPRSPVRIYPLFCDFI